MSLIHPLVKTVTGQLTRQHEDFDTVCLKGCQFAGEADGPNVLNGTTVSRLADQSGNQHHAVQSVAINQPVFVGSSPIFNGKSALHFQGNDDLRFSGNGLDMFRNTNGFTCFVVARVDSFAALQFCLFASISTNLTTTRMSMFPQTNQVLWGALRRLDTDTGLAGFGGSVNSTDPFIFEMVVDFDATTLTLYLDGIVIYQNLNTSTGYTSDTPSLGISIGSSNGSNYFTGFIPAVLTYRRALNAIERSYIRQGLGRKYGIATT